jgi:hypothetical protein
MRERVRQLNGRLEIATQPGGSTRHEASIPPDRLPSILRARFLSSGSCVRLPKAQFSPAAKTQNRETPYFQCIPQTPLRPSPPRPHNSLGPSPLFTRSPPSARRFAVPCSQTAAV